MDEEIETDATIERFILEVLERAGATDALDDALASATRGALPTRSDELVAFIEEHLSEALTGRVHPVTARALIDELLEGAASRDGSGMRARHAQPDTPTLAPPPIDGASDAYDDLASGAVHTRPTPTWGLRPVSGADALAPVTWLLVSTDRALLALARHGAPAGTEVVEAASTDELAGALSEGDALAVVLDGAAPSVELEPAIALLAPSAARVLVWRMAPEVRQRMLDPHPGASTWLPCDVEVTPAELLQLLALEARRDDD